MARTVNSMQAETLLANSVSVDPIRKSLEGSFVDVLDDETSCK